MKDHIKELEAMGACDYAREWAKGYKTATDAWKACERPNWMVWYLAKKLDLKALCILLGKIAMDTPIDGGRTVWDIMPEAGRECLRVLRRWIDGQATEEELIQARYTTTTTTAASAATAAAYAAATAAATTATAATAATAATTAAAAYAKKWQCALIRERYPDIEAVRAKDEGRSE